MADYETVNVRRDGAAATIELNRPESLNAWNAQLGHDLLAAVTERRAGRRGARRASHRRGARVLGRRRPARPVRARGAHARGPPRRAQGPDRALPPDHHARSATMPKPVLAAVNGPAVGIGLSLALAADLVVAAESAYLLLAFVNIGLVPDGGSSLFVPTRVGFARAAEMAMLGERIPAAAGARAGAWSTASCPTTPSRPRSRALRDRLAAGPTRSYAGSQAPAQPLALRAHGGAARARGRHPAGDGGLAGLRRGRRRLRREAPAGVRGRVDRATYGSSSAGL